MPRGKLARLCVHGWLIAAAMLFVAAPSAAQAQSPDTARSLVTDARKLMKAGHYDEACPKLEAATKLDATAGALLALGDCYLHTNRSASASTAFGDAASAATRAGHAKEAADAKRRQTTLEPKLSKLTIRVTTEAPGLVVKRDDTPVDHAAWGTAVPVDAGTHQLSAEAPGRAAWTSSVVVSQPGQTVNVDIPDLQPLPTTPVAATDTGSPAGTDSPASPTKYWTTRRVTGVAIAGAGVVGVGVGGILGLVAKSQYNKAAGENGTQRHDDSDSAVNTGNVATIVAGVSAAVAIGGLVLWLTAPSAQVQVGASGGTVLVRGTF